MTINWCMYCHTQYHNKYYIKQRNYIIKLTYLFFRKDIFLKIFNDLKHYNNISYYNNNNNNNHLMLVDKYCKC